MIEVHQTLLIVQNGFKKCYFQPKLRTFSSIGRSFWDRGSDVLVLKKDGEIFLTTLGSENWKWDLEVKVESEIWK